MLRLIVLMLLGIAAASAQTAPQPPGGSAPKLYLHFWDLATGMWSFKPVVIEGAVLDTSGATAVLKLAAASTVDYRNITNRPKFAGPWLLSKLDTSGVETVGVLIPREATEKRTMSAPGADFPLVQIPIDGSLRVLLNGVERSEGDHYRLVVGADKRVSVVLFSPALTGDIIVIRYRY